jgi:hypothetical protein
MIGINDVISWMLMMVMKKPMQLTIVRADPTSSLGAVYATRVENWGESPTTTIPQKIKKDRNNSGGA